MSHKEQPSSDKTIDWNKLNTEWEASPLSQKAFCQAKEISYSLFVSKRAYWLKKRKRPVKQTFAPVTVAPIKAAKVDPVLSLRLPSGARLDIPPSINTSHLKPILVALEVIC